MKNIKYFIMLLPMLLLCACDVHEWPDRPEKVQFILKLNYEMDMTKWLHKYDGKNLTELGYGETYDNSRESGKIRYIVRAYPLLKNQLVSQDYSNELIFTKDIADGYDHEMTLELAPGDYSIMVWSDLVENSSVNPYYNASAFGEISLQGEHAACNDYRDAFRGKGNISLVSDVVESNPCELEIAMQRPLAKFEFVTNDLTEFIRRETARLLKGNASKLLSDDEPTAAKVRIEDYEVVFRCVGFMPDTYSIFTDKPVDSSTGVVFSSSLKAIKEGETSLGFDYVFVNGTESSVTLQIGICDPDDLCISLTDPIKVPLKRSHHTIISGKFLTAESSNGVIINPDYDGDYNIIFP